MGKKIIVDPAKLKTASTQINEEVASYKTTYAQIYTDVENLAASWSGADNTAFTNQIKGFRDDFDNMSKLMTEYAQYLTDSASAYQAAQDEITRAAGKLTN